jgi:hypothetical protein
MRRPGDKLPDWARRVAELDAQIAPIAKRPVDINEPGWVAKMQQRPHPLDEAEVRDEAEALLDELIEAYADGDDHDREAIRGLFRSHPWFEWAATLHFPPTTPGSFRRHLILFSMKDQGRDARDAILELEALCRAGSAAGILARPVIEEVARISSGNDRFGMGSTRKLLSRAAGATV